MSPEQRAKRIKKLYQIMQRQFKEASREGISVKFDHKGWSRDIPSYELGSIYVSQSFEDN